MSDLRFNRRAAYGAVINALSWIVLIALAAALTLGFLWMWDVTGALGASIYVAVVIVVLAFLVGGYRDSVR